jgi:hypothetical protein
MFKLQTNKPSDLFLLLLHSATQAHIFHLEISNKSTSSAYAIHKALNEYYDEVVEASDNLIEVYQGMYGIVDKYSGVLSIINYKSPETICNYLKNIASSINSMRYTAFKKEDSNIQNEIDTIISLVYKTLYKIENL